MDFASVLETFSQTRRMDEGIDKRVIYFLGCPSLAQPHKCHSILMPFPTRPAEGNIALLFDKASGKRAWRCLTTHITKSVPNQQSVTVWSLSSATNSFQSSMGEITIIPLLLFVLSKAIEKQKHVCSSDGRENNVEGEPFNTSKLGIIVFLRKFITTIWGISRERKAQLSLCDGAFLL